MKNLIAFVLVIALAGQSLWAQPDPKHIEKVRSKVIACRDKGTAVSVETYDGRKLAGNITRADLDNFELSAAGGTITLAYSDIKKVKAPMDKRTRGFIVAGIVLAALLGGTAAALANDK